MIKGDIAALYTRALPGGLQYPPKQFLCLRRAIGRASEEL